MPRTAAGKGCEAKLQQQVSHRDRQSPAKRSGGISSALWVFNYEFQHLGNSQCPNQPETESTECMLSETCPPQNKAMQNSLASGKIISLPLDPITIHKELISFLFAINILLWQYYLKTLFVCFSVFQLGMICYSQEQSFKQTYS